MSSFQKTVLDNGISVVSEDHPSSRAVSCGIWIETGTRFENMKEMGISHFLEHMVFKGTRKRNAYKLVRDLEEVGAEVNAFTTREHTCFHSLSLHESLSLCVEVLSDLVCNATFPSKELELERNVVIQEILSSEDAPDEYVFDLFLEKYFPNNSLGYSILGTEATVKSFTQKKTKEYYKHNYVGSKIVVAAAGRLNHEELVDQVRKYLGRIKKKKRQLRYQRARPTTFRSIHEKDAETVHMLLGFPATSFKDDSRFEAFIVNALIGGGMTSKLYQTVREDQGLVYSIYSNLSTFSDTGLINIYASSAPKHIKKVTQLVLKELKQVKKRGVSESDLQMFKNQVRAGILLGADDVENRMNSLGVNEMVFRNYRPVEEVIAEIEAVNLDRVHLYLEDHFNLSKLSFLFYGPMSMDNDGPWLDSLET